MVKVVGRVERGKVVGLVDVDRGRQFFVGEQDPVRSNAENFREGKNRFRKQSRELEPWHESLHLRPTIMSSPGSKVMPRLVATPELAKALGSWKTLTTLGVCFHSIAPNCLDN